MGLIQCNFYSTILRKPVLVNTIIPDPSTNEDWHSNYINNTKFPVIWLLHGLGGGAFDWIKNTEISSLANKYKFAVIIPQVERSFYSNLKNGSKYWDFIVDELYERMQSLFPLSRNRSDNFVMGNSMGGYGALKWGISHPDLFSKVIALSPVINLVPFYNDEFGVSPDFKLAFSRKGLESQSIISQISKININQRTPSIFMSYGTKDFLFNMDKTFKDYCENNSLLNSKLTTLKTSGEHNWEQWQGVLHTAIDWIFNN